MQRILVDLDLRTDARIVERGAQAAFDVRVTLMIVLRDRNQETRFHLRNQQMRTVIFVSRQSATVERTAGADAFRYRRSGIRPSPAR